MRTFEAKSGLSGNCPINPNQRVAQSTVTAHFAEEIENNENIY